MQFKLIEFNSRRYSRGASAARVECEGEWLWMSVKDVENNIRDFGEHPELLKARECYRRPTERFPAAEEEPKPPVPPKPDVIRPCWITTEGEVILCPIPMAHIYAAADRFPKMCNPAHHVEQLGWVKITGYGDPPHLITFRPMNQRQIDALEQHCGNSYPKMLAEYADVFEMAVQNG